MIIKEISVFNKQYILKIETTNEAAENLLRDENVIKRVKDLAQDIFEEIAIQAHAQDEGYDLTKYKVEYLKSEKKQNITINSNGQPKVQSNVTINNAFRSIANTLSNDHVQSVSLLSLNDQNEDDDDISVSSLRQSFRVNVNPDVDPDENESKHDTPQDRKVKKE